MFFFDSALKVKVDEMSNPNNDSEVYILQKYESYSPALRKRARVFFPTFFQKGAKKGP